MESSLNNYSAGYLKDTKELGKESLKEYRSEVALKKLAAVYEASLLTLRNSRYKESSTGI